MYKRVSRFDFGKADVDEMILHLSAVDWLDLLRSDCVYECVQKFYDAIYECFELYVPKCIVRDSIVKYPWFDRELHNVDNNRTKAHKSLKKLKQFMIARCPNQISICATRLSAVFENLGVTLRVFPVQNTPSTSCVLRVV
jgi:hypothetical protein